MKKNNKPIMEFHISREARDYYQFEESMFSSSGNVIFGNFHASRTFAQKMNQKRDLVSYPEQAVRAGQINAMGLIDEILHLVFNLYRQENNPIVMQEALDWLYGMLGQDAVDQTFLQFVIQFPPTSVYQGILSPEEYIDGESGELSHRQIILEEMLLLWLANKNPAFSPFKELFDDSLLVKESTYFHIIPLIHAFFETQLTFGPESQNLVDMLRSPAIAEPHSLSGQLEFIRQHWGYLIGKYIYNLLSSLDLIKEEEKAAFLGSGPSRVYEFTGLDLEPERFSQDKDWMPSLVLIAKNTYVWLDQLSKKYQFHIHRLDQIPDEEIDTLAKWGFTGLWLIGLWERSSASKRIKQLRGNPEAEASAYSLFEYQIAEDLGGDEAYQNLRERAWQRRIRLAADMVPNHMGIDSRWVIEHPEWFISLNYSPFPSYTFNGPNFSWDERTGIYIEDHYFDNTDAAVVFKRVDFWNGEERYIYHGNDGTSMPWNDTAQLNFLLPDVREAVIQTILHVARKFPVIRFDAAMTLSKKHYHRLWFPEPGSGGDIPSRAEYGMTKADFDVTIPEEFWREVVDRVSQEVPDTLLLAEAFWLMEGYFVRTLGMHRVYNSAFMNMLRDEKNADYRLVIKNTLEFDPEILKRYVNFMNNPDERTTVDQFGMGDKYFGICTMMVTLPGLPMFGHGQIEGFTEKYGMEYRRAYWDEKPDSYLIDRHQRDIFPLLRKRYLFAEVRDFLLYDFHSLNGHVNEDVFAYSNRSGDESGLVIYHNKFSTAKGWIRSSAAYSIKDDSGERALVQKSLGEGLGIQNDSEVFTIFRDYIEGLEYIRNNRELVDKGLYVELEAYKYQVFLDFHEVSDDEYRRYSQLAEYLNGRGVPSIDEAMKEVFLQPIHQPYRELINAGFFRWLITNRATSNEAEAEKIKQVHSEIYEKLTPLFEKIKKMTNGSGDEEVISEDVWRSVQALLQITALDTRYPNQRSRKYQSALNYLGLIKNSTSSWREGNSHKWGTLLGWLFTYQMGRIVDEIGYESISRSWIDEWLLGKIIAGAMSDLGVDEHSAWGSVNIIKILTIHHAWWKQIENTNTTKKASKITNWLQSLLSDNDVQQYIGVNRYQGVLWFNKESYEVLLWWFFSSAVVEICASVEQNDISDTIINSHEIIKKLLKAGGDSGYQVEKLIDEVKHL
jgi:hypothetical protein